MDLEFTKNKMYWIKHEDEGTHLMLCLKLCR